MTGRKERLRYKRGREALEVPKDAATGITPEDIEDGYCRDADYD